MVGIDIGEDYDGYSNWVHDCCFLTGNADNTLGEYGIKLNNTDDCVGTLIENNFFYFMSTAGIVVGATRCTIRNNVIYSNAIGIDVKNAAGSFAGTTILGNYLIGRATGSTVGIQLAETTEGSVFVANNIITNFNTNITANMCEQSIVNNQTAADASTYKQVDATP